MKLRTNGLTAIATALLAAGSFAQTSFPEIEPNALKAEATAVTGIVAGDSITGTSTGTVTTAASTLVTTADTFRITNSALPLGIYKHTLTLTSATVGHTGSIRGLNQTGVTGTASTGGTPGTTDAAVQTSSTTSVNPPPRSNVWYGFGKQEELYYRVTGGSTTTAAYTATMSTTAVTATVIPQALESSGPITISSIGQTTADTEVKVYDSNLNSLAGFDNDDEGPAGATLQSRLTRTYAPGTYFLAMGRSNTAWNHPSPADEDFFSNIMDFPNVVVCSSTTPTTTVDDRDFTITGCNGTVFQANQVAFPDSFSIQWFSFTVALGAPQISTPANDACASATVIGATGGTFNDTVSGGTNDGSASCDPGGVLSRDVWYTYTNGNATARLLSVNTCTTTGVDSVVSIHTSCADTIGSACNDDCGGAPCGGPSSCTSLLVAPAQVVLVRVSDKGLGGCGNFRLVATVAVPPPSNDSCATPIAVVAGNTPWDNTGGTTGVEGQTEALCLAAAQTAINKDLWYTYTPTSNGTVTVSTCGLMTSASQDSKIAIYAGTACPAAGTAVACNDDFTCTGFSGLNATVSFTPVCGTTYLIQIGSFGATTSLVGAFSIVETPGTGCSTPFTVFCDGSAVGTTCLGCGNNGAPNKGCANSVFPGGTQLVSGGIASVGTDTLTLTTTDMTGPGLFFQSNGLAASPITFGDGMLCASVGIARLGVVFPTAGSATYPGGLTPNPITVAGAPIAAGDTKHYQCWYRDTPVFCTSATFNLSNGVTLVWGP